MSLSHLQFADDTIFFCSEKEESFFILSHILAFFEAMSRLKINRGKCQVLGLNCTPQKVGKLAALVGCDIGSFLSSHLGLPLGHNPRNFSFWNLVVDKVRKRLPFSKSSLEWYIEPYLLDFKWDSISFFSLSRAPCVFCKSLEKLMSNFLWEGVD